MNNMPRRRRLLPLPLPPPPPAGYMWLHRKLRLIVVVEMEEQQIMEKFDYNRHLFGDEYWRNDPSYDWAAQTKRKKRGISEIPSPLDGSVA
jgi:hypothetical protein